MCSLFIGAAAVLLPMIAQLAQPLTAAATLQELLCSWPVCLYQDA
jgi:hypothetical protein